MSDQGEHQMTTIQHLRDCRHYATLLCAARICEQRWHARTVGVDVCGRVARAIYREADPTIHAALDTIKRVMEIDETVDNPNAVLMHAGIALQDNKATNQGEPT